MSETQNNSSLSTFLQKKSAKKDVVTQQAQQLVNLYRHLSSFGENFQETFNRKLLEAPAEVQIALSTIIGGSIVRQYLEFLQTQNNIQQPDDPQMTFQEGGYLPSAENDPTPIFAAKQEEPLVPKENIEHTQSLKSILKTIVSLYQNETAKQTTFLNGALKNMQEGLVQQIVSLKTAEQSASLSPDHLLHFQKTQQDMLDRALQKMTETQMTFLSETLKQIMESNREVMNHQTEKILRILQDEKTKSPGQTLSSSERPVKSEINIISSSGQQKDGGKKND